MAVRLAVVGSRLEIEIIRPRAVDRLVLNRADAIEPGLVEPVEQETKVLLRLAGKADDEGRADGQFRADRPPDADAIEGFLLIARPPHRTQHRRRSVLERDV